MTFLSFKYIIIIIIVYIFVTYLLYRHRKKYFYWINKYWFFDSSKKNFISFILLNLGILILLISVLDLRGPVSNEKVRIPKQKTVIMLDISSSMLVEDVNPNRLERAIFYSRHFVKNSPGHQLSFVIFSDYAQIVLPYSTDIDLLDSRIKGVSALQIKSGGSNISKAIVEVIQHFHTKYKVLNEHLNIIVFSDFEEHQAFKMPEFKNVSLALISVGTTAGGYIPVRTASGEFMRFKRHNKKNVVSKMSIKAINAIRDKFINAKLWISKSSQMPTSEILNFFNISYKQRMSIGEIKVREVYGNYLILFGLLLLTASSLLGLGKSFSCKIIVFFLITTKGFVQEFKFDEMEKKVINGDISTSELLKLGELYLRSKQYKKSLIIYESNEHLLHLEMKEEMFNYIVVLLKNQKYNKAAQLASEIREMLIDINTEESLLMLKNLRSNILNLVNNNKEKQNKNEKQNKDKKQEKDKNEKQNKKNKNEKQNKKNNDKQDKKNKDDSSSKQQNSKQSNVNNNMNNKDIKSGNPSDKQKRNMSNYRKMMEMPKMLQQILSDDKNLQGKYLKTQYKELDVKQKYKDW